MHQLDAVAAEAAPAAAASAGDSAGAGAGAGVEELNASMYCWLSITLWNQSGFGGLVSVLDAAALEDEAAPAPGPVVAAPSAP